MKSQMKKSDLSDVVEYISHSALDIRRRERTGIIEAIYAEYKSAEKLSDIVQSLLKRRAPVFITRIDEEKARYLISKYRGLVYNREARICYLPEKKKRSGLVSVVSAGTADGVYVEEAFQTLTYLGNNARKIVDVGVAGIHRLAPYIKVLRRSSAVIVIAGMEGALPSLIGGLVSVPVIAVPSPIGYGVSSGGYAALLGMLSSCSPNVSVVNIGNTFGAACIASLINHRRGR